MPLFGPYSIGRLLFARAARSSIAQARQIALALGGCSDDPFSQNFVNDMWLAGIVRDLPATYGPRNRSLDSDPRPNIWGVLEMPQGSRLK